MNPVTEEKIVDVQEGDKVIIWLSFGYLSMLSFGYLSRLSFGYLSRLSFGYLF